MIASVPAIRLLVAECHLLPHVVGVRHKAVPQSSRIRLSVSGEQMMLFNCPDLP